MKTAALAILEELKNRFLENPRQRVSSANVATLITLILELIDQTDAEIATLSACVDDLARHTGYQLEQKAGEAANG